MYHTRTILAIKNCQFRVFAIEINKKSVFGDLGIENYGFFSYSLASTRNANYMQM